MRLYSVILALLPLAAAGQYVLEDDYSPTSFASMMSFFTGDDPTHGYVNYLSQSASEISGIFKTDGSSVTLGVDSTKVATGRGRDSVRVESTKQYNGGLFILDATHMPEGCGTWPAFWLYGPNWPNSGEIDIIEGVNSQAANSFAAHTRSGCSISNTGFTGTLDTSNCDVNAPGQGTNVGCGIKSSDTRSYGSGFNANGGGVYATEWTSAAINIWFFPRGSIPSDITSGSPMPSTWGSPAAQFAAPCDIDQYFVNQRIVLNTALCGDWAGGVWGQDTTCSAAASTCQDFVQNNPSAFDKAFWSISSLRVYQQNGAPIPSTTLSTPIPTTLSTIPATVPVSITSTTTIGIPTSSFPPGLTTTTTTIDTTTPVSTTTDLTSFTTTTSGVTTTTTSLIITTPSTFITSTLTQPFPTSIFLPSPVDGASGLPITEAPSAQAPASTTTAINVPPPASSDVRNGQPWSDQGGGREDWNGGRRWGGPPGRRFRS